jgi:hypothetical protein
MAIFIQGRVLVCCCGKVVYKTIIQIQRNLILGYQINYLIMNKSIVLFSLVFSTFFSCKKDNAIENDTPVTEINPEFLTCNCSIQQEKDAADEYLKASVNGVQVCADIKRGFQESFDNMFTYGIIKRSTGNTYYDNLYMIRYTKDGKFMMGIFMENTHLLTKQFPYELPRGNPEVCEIGEFQLQNQQQITPIMCAFCPTNNWHYNGSFFGNQLKFIADKFENGFFEGRFEGMIFTGSGRSAVVKDGKFKIKLAIINKDIIIP